MFKPKVTIITPTYNHEKYISKCINSVIIQTYTNWEMIIIDDGSTDSTGQICERMAQTDHRITYIRQENLGLSKLSVSYNKAFKQSTGEYIAILEGDDYWYENRLEFGIKEFKNPDIVFSWCSCHIVNERDEIIGTMPRKLERYKSSTLENDPVGSFLNFLNQEFPIPVTWIIRKSVLSEKGGFLQDKNTLTVDLSTLLPIIIMGKFSFQRTKLAAFRRQLNQATRTRLDEIVETNSAVFLHFISSLPEEVFDHANLKKEKVKKGIYNKITIAHSVQGRSNLVKKEFEKARYNFKKGLFGKGSLLLPWRVKSFVGIIFSYFKIDLEWVAVIFNKNTYKS